MPCETMCVKQSRLRGVIDFHKSVTNQSPRASRVDCANRRNYGADDLTASDTKLANVQSVLFAGLLEGTCDSHTLVRWQLIKRGG
jgi:hypothetical protein